MKYAEILQIFTNGGFDDVQAEKAATALCEYCGGTEVYIGVVPSYIRNEKIYRLWLSGVKQCDIGERFNLSDAAISAICCSFKN